MNFPGADALADFVLARNLDEKRTLAVKSGLLSERQSAFIRHTASVRNRYAHNIKNISLSVPEMAEKISPPDSGSEILSILCNYREGDKKIPSFMRTLLFWNFSSLLSVVIKGIKPPAFSQDIPNDLLEWLD